MKTSRNIFIAFITNLLFSIFELVGGLFTNSIAILSDSIHDFGDALSIGISFFLERKSKKGADSKHTYGYIRYSVLGSVITATVLLAGSIIVIIGSIERLIHPVPVDHSGMLFLAIIGIVLNSIAAFVTRRGDSLNQKTVNLHMLEDVLSWVVVLIGSIIMRFTNISIIDPLMSLGVAIFILVNVIRNFLSILDLFLEKTPKNVNLKNIKSSLLTIDGVKDVHHIHVRSIDGFNNYATLHVVVDKYSQATKQKIKEHLSHQNIHHSTIELELADDKCHEQTCKTAPTDNHHHKHKH